VDVSCWGEKKRCVKRLKLSLMVFGGGVGYYASVSMWGWYLHVYLGFYVSFGRVLIAMRLLRNALACHYARLWYMVVSAGTVTVTVTVTVCPVAKGKVTDI